MGSIHAARLDHSPRLQRLLGVFRANPGVWLSTRSLILAANICAVNSAVDELRENKYPISTKRTQEETGPVWWYRLEEGA